MEREWKIIKRGDHVPFRVYCYGAEEGGFLIKATYPDRPTQLACVADPDAAYHVVVGWDGKGNLEDVFGGEAPPVSTTEKVCPICGVSRVDVTRHIKRLHPEAG